MMPSTDPHGTLVKGCNGARKHVRRADIIALTGEGLGTA
jgi:hypothetical protein